MKRLSIPADPGYAGYATGGNERTAFLKVIALVFMVIDHAGVALFHNMLEMRALGRLAFPIYCWCVVVGMGHTRNPARYSLRLLLMAAASQFFYMKALNHEWYQFNVIVTLLLGQLAVYGLQRRWCLSQWWAPALAIAVSLAIRVDYGFKGVLLIILLYLAKDSRSSILAVMIAYCLFWGEGTGAVSTLFGVDLTPLSRLLRDSSSLTRVALRLQNLAVLSLPFIVYPIGWQRRHANWLSYLAYPGHLLIIWIIQLAIGGR